jgi:hypothetical protein
MDCSVSGGAVYAINEVMVRAVGLPLQLCERLYEPSRGGFAGSADDGRQIFESCAAELPAWDWDKVAAHGSNDFMSRRR